MALGQWRWASSGGTPPKTCRLDVLPAHCDLRCTPHAGRQHLGVHATMPHLSPPPPAAAAMPSSTSAAKMVCRLPLMPMEEM